jgi:hypothetical protein
MSGHGKREKVLRADAARGRDKVCADIASAAGCAAMSERRISAQLINDVVNAVVRYIAAGEDRVVNYRNSRQRRAVEYLAARGHVEILAGDLIRPAGVRGDELVWW